MKLLFKFSWQIALISLLLSVVGILVIFSSSSNLAILQFLFVLLGFVFFIFICSFDYRSLKGFIIPLYLLIIFLLLSVLVIGTETRGSLRWISIGFFNIQPSEFAKPAIILFLAHFWSKNAPSWINIFKSILWTSPFLLIIFKQPDLGSTIVIAGIWFGMLIGSKISFKKILVIFLVLLFILPVFWFTLHDYQKNRFSAFLSPQSDPLGEGYNIIQSTIAVGSGQFLGRGIGRGTQSRLQFLPEFRTDFIFASMAEELGFSGSIIILFLYMILFFSILRYSSQSFDFFGTMICFGVLSMLILQVFINIGMNIGLLPITGITLPLLSYGGSSVLSTFISLGFVCSVAKISSLKKVDM
jgi:rod shape determining protein RodA